MNLRLWTRSALVLVAAAVLVVSGCGQTDDKAAKKDLPKDKGTGPVAQKKASPDDGWWCKEHGIPEDECSMCSDKVAKECKAKNDWCKEHDRAESQCFICHPELKEKFAARYRAKYGQEPPPPTANMPKKDGESRKESK